MTLTTTDGLVSGTCHAMNVSYTCFSCHCVMIHIVPTNVFLASCVSVTVTITGGALRMRGLCIVYLLCLLRQQVVLSFFSATALSPRRNHRQGLGVSSLRAGLLDDIGKMAANLGGSAPAQVGRPLYADAPAPSWQELRSAVLVTPTGLSWEENKRLWAEGAGPPDTDAKVRLFGTEGEPRVVFFRDTAAWCPYCQKNVKDPTLHLFRLWFDGAHISEQVWMMLEEKKIPYRVEKINMRSYGEKPAWYLAQVPSGLLPAIKLDGKLMTESLAIMQTLEAYFPGSRPMLPDREAPEFQEAVRLLNLERELFSWWCQFVFRSGNSARGQCERTLDQVNDALDSSHGPWFLRSSASTDEAANGSPDDGFSLVDLTYVPHLERMAASTAYWKGLQLRGNPRWPAINRWFEALEMRETYMATKSDFYTHVKDIPPQYGNGQSVSEAADMAAAIDGADGSWSLPLPPLHPTEGLEPVLAINDRGGDGARHEAAYKLTGNADAVARFSCRGAGRGSGWSLLPGRAPLSDPNAEPNMIITQDVDFILRRVTSALLKGSLEEDEAALAIEGGDEGTLAAVTASLSYLRDRIGVPRDMSYPAARQLRAHLNWAISILNA